MRYVLIHYAPVHLAATPTCPQNLVYRSVEVCKSLCRDALYMNGSCLPGTVQGCACDKGEVKGDDNVCHEPPECTCYDASRGVIYQPGETDVTNCQRWYGPRLLVPLIHPMVRHNIRVLSLCHRGATRC